jgi:hypothetical protein
MEVMNNILGNTLSFATAWFGVSQMEYHDFSPTTMFFFIIGIMVLSFLGGLVGEQIQNKFKRFKENVMGLGNRYG